MNSEEYGELKGLVQRRCGSLDKRFDALGERFDRLEGQLETRFSAVDRRFELIDRRFEQVDQRFIELEANLRAEIRAAAVETRAHFDMVAEKFAGGVRKIAEGYDHHTTVLDDHEARLQRIEQARLRFD